MKMEDLIRSAEAKVRGLQRDYETSRASLVQMRERIDGPNPPTEEQTRAAADAHGRLSDRLDDARAELTTLQSERLADLEVAAAQRDVTDTGASRTGGTMNQNQTGRAYVVSEPSQYTQHAERTGEASFLQDLYSAQIKNDSQAHERLARHGREIQATTDLNKRVGTTTSTTPSFVPPAYLSDLFADFSRRGRPMANLMTSLPLPPTGMTITIPRVTSPSSVAVQGSENVAVAEAAMADTPLELDVVTVGGFVPISRQLWERGVLVEEMVQADLASAYAEQVDTLVVDAAMDQANTNAITFTDNTSPTVVELWPKLADAVGRVRSLSFRGATSILMHPRRWSWCLAALSSDDDRPIFPVTAANPVNAMGVGTSTEYDEPAGQVLGLPVWLDANIPTNTGTATNEDTIFVADFRDSVIFEEPNRAPAQLRFEAAGGSTLTVNLVAYGYSALTFGRHPASLSKINGSGLVAPGAL